MNSALLKAVMIQNGDNQTRLAEAMGLPQSAISLRINGLVEFKQSEINFIRKRYNLTDEQTILIFFDEKVS